MREILSQRLRELRESMGLSQKALSEKISVSAASIGYYENGDRIPGLDVAAELANFFGVSLDYLAGRSDSRTHESADISARTGLSERAVLLLEAKHRMQGKHGFLLSDSAIISRIIETIAQPLTLEEYLSSVWFFYVTDDTGNEVGKLYIGPNHKKHETECYVLQDDIEGVKDAFYLSDFAETEALPIEFRRMILENYQCYEKLVDKNEKSPDIIGLLRKFFELDTIGNAKLLYNRNIGIGWVAGDQTDSLFDVEDEEQNHLLEHLSNVCDETDSAVTALPIGALLDESTFSELKIAFTKLRAKYTNSKEATDAQEE